MGGMQTSSVPSESATRRLSDSAGAGLAERPKLPSDSASADTHAFSHEAVQLGWDEDRRAQRKEDVELLFFVKMTHRSKLKDVLQNISDPRNPAYGHFLTKREVDALTAPRQESVDAVENALQGHRFTKEKDGAIISAVVPVAFAERLLGGTFVYYCRREQITAGGSQKNCLLRNPSARVPAKLRAACDIISPLRDPLPARGHGAIISSRPTSLAEVEGPGVLRPEQRVHAAGSGTVVTTTVAACAVVITFLAAICGRRARSLTPMAELLSCQVPSGVE